MFFRARPLLAAGGARNRCRPEDDDDGGDADGEGGEEFPNSIYTTPDRPPQRLLLVIY